MRVLNVVELDVVRNFLKRYYSANNIEHIFIEPGKIYEEPQDDIIPDMVLTQDQYFDVSGVDIVNAVTKKYLPLRQNIKITILQLSDSNEFYSALDNEILSFANIMLVNNQNEIVKVIGEAIEEIERKKRNKILVVDDNRVTIEILRRAFLKNGFNIIAAQNGMEAYEIILREHPDIIITDIEMPLMDGYALCERIKENKELKDIPLLIISAKDKPSDIKKGESLGIVRYFVKPFDMEQIVLIVEQLLQQNHSILKKENEYTLSSIKSLVKALESKDTYTKGHSERVADLSVRLGRAMGMDESFISELEIGASLHDIGKIGVSDEILQKPGKLTSNEFEKVKEHPLIGSRILEPIISLKNIIPLILLHHERWDEKGYPTKVGGEKIPIGARIIAIADAFDAITSERPYRKGTTIEAALKIIKENTGTQFCPYCVEHFLKMMVNL